MEDQEEVWPPAPCKQVDCITPPYRAQPSIWLQIAIGLPASLIFVPVLWLGMLWSFHVSTADETARPVMFAGGAFLIAMMFSVLVGRRYLAFAILFGVVSGVMAAFAGFLSLLPGPPD